MSYNSFLPNILLKNQNNEIHNFHDILGNNKIIILTMFYATCELKCIPVALNMVRVNRLLDNLIEKNNIHFVSISLDSNNDSLEDLKNFNNKINSKSCLNWNTYIGDYDEIEDLRFKLCMNNDDNLEIDKDITQHFTNSLIINNKMGQVRHINSFENPINISRRLLQLSTENFGKQNGCNLLQYLKYNLLKDDELFENILTINDRYTIPYLPKDILIKLEKYARNTQKKNFFNYKPLETAFKRQKDINNSNYLNEDKKLNKCKCK